LVDVFVPVWVGIRTSHARYRQNTCQNTCQYVLVCIEYIPIPPLRIGHVLMHVFRYVFACINYWYVPIHTKYTSNTCKIRTNTDWYVSIHTRHVSIHALNTYKNTYQNTYQYGAVVLVRICTYQVSIRALHFPDVMAVGNSKPNQYTVRFRQMCPNGPIYVLTSTSDRHAS